MLFASWLQQLKSLVSSSHPTPRIRHRKPARARLRLESLEDRTVPSATWTQLAPTGGPPTSRYGYEMAADQAHDKMIVFGGITNGYAMVDNTVWILDNADGQGGAPAWHPLAIQGSSPSTRSFGAYGYNPDSNRMLVFSGDTQFGGLPKAVNELWVLSAADGLGGSSQWLNLTPPSGPTPGPRYAVSGAYDTANNRFIIFGGDDAYNGTYNDVWVLANADGSTGAPAWTQLNPAGATLPALSNCIEAYDPSNNRLIVAGGVGPASYATNAPFGVWVLSNANGLGGTPTWTQLSTTGDAPPPPYLSSGIFDPTNNSLVVFGGTSLTNGFLNQTWVLSNANNPSPGVPHVWTVLNPQGSLPAPRDLMAPLYNANSDSMTVYGGRQPGGIGAFGDVWVLSNLSAPATDSTAPTTTASLSGTQGSNGRYTTSVQVTLSAMDPDNDPSTLTTYYQVDGGAQQTYAGPFSVPANGAHTILYWSADPAGNTESPAQSVSFTIDTTPPVTTATLSGNNTVTLTAADPDDASPTLTTHYKVDGNAWQIYGGPFSVTGSGQHTVLYYSADPAGNAEPTETLSFYVGTVTSQNGTFNYTDPNGTPVSIVLSGGGTTTAGSLTLVPVPGYPGRAQLVGLTLTGTTNGTNLKIAAPTGTTTYIGSVAVVGNLHDVNLANVQVGSLSIQGSIHDFAAGTIQGNFQLTGSSHDIVVGNLLTGASLTLDGSGHDVTLGNIEANASFTLLGAAHDIHAGNIAGIFDVTGTFHDATVGLISGHVHLSSIGHRFTTASKADGSFSATGDLKLLDGGDIQLDTLSDQPKVRTA